MAKTKIKFADASKISQIANEIVEVPIEKFLEEEYLPYSYYVILNRALVNADGLKPVQKRIIYEMYKSKLYNPNPHLKASTIAGNVMGKFHPHGDSSISDAMSRMGQDFSLRVPLVDPSGSVGYFPGDAPAAPRYWEARLTPAAVELVKEVDYDALPMGRNFDDTKDEPTILPVRWPSVLINGTEGIAVGYASTIFPHNPTEVMSAIIEFVKNPELTIDEVMKIMPGPDFPTGGEILQSENLKECYESGRGSVVLRSRYTVEPLPRGRHRIVLTELPYQVAARQIVGEIRKKRSPKNKNTKPIFTYISSEKNLSDQENGTRVEIILKSGTNVNLALEEIFKSTSASKSISFNQTVIADGSPTLSSIFDIFDNFINLRRTCILNYSQSKLDKNNYELNKLNGLLIVLVDIDKAIDIIKSAEEDIDALKGLMSEFGINKEQAEYILNLRLRSLKNKNTIAIENNIKSLEEENAKLKLLLSDEDVLNEELISQLEATKKLISDPRRTLINNKTVEELKAEEKDAKKQAAALSKNSDYELIMYSDGKIMKYLSADKTALKPRVIPYQYKIQAKSNDDLYAVYADGTATKVPSSYVPFDNLISEKKIGIKEGFLALGKSEPSKKDLGLFIMTSSGKVSLVNSTPPVSKNEWDLVTLEDDDKIIFAKWVTNKEKDMNVLAASNDSQIINFPLSTIRVSKFGGKPIKGMVLNDGAKLIGVSLVNKKGLIFTMTKTTIKTTDLDEIPTKNRGGKGMIIHKGKLSGDLIGMFAAEEKELSITDLLGNELFLPPVSSRAAAGMKFSPVGLIFGTKDK